MKFRIEYNVNNQRCKEIQRLQTNLWMVLMIIAVIPINLVKIVTFRGHVGSK
jgi:hypothetical protein